MTAKRFNLRKVVDLKFAALANKELRRFHWLLATNASIEDHNDVTLLPKLEFRN